MALYFGVMATTGFLNTNMGGWARSKYNGPIYVRYYH